MRIVWISLRLFITFGILYYIFDRIPFSSVSAVFSSAKADYIVVASFLTILSHLIGGYRLSLISESQGMSISLLKAFDINSAAAFYRLFLPGGTLTGGAIRIYKLSRHSKKVAEAFASITFDRAIATIALCVVGIFFWLIHLPSDAEYILVTMSIVLSVLVVIIGFLLVDKSRMLERRIPDLLGLSFIFSYIQKFLETLNRFKSLSSISIGWIIVISIFTNLLGILVYYKLAQALGIDISFIAMGWIRSAVVFVTLIPISISGLGLREVSLIFLLKSYGIREDEALALSLLVFAVTVIMTGFIGGFLEGRRFLQAGA